MNSIRHWWEKRGILRTGMKAQRNLRTLNSQVFPSLLCHLWQTLSPLEESDLPWLEDSVTLKDVEVGIPITIYVFHLHLPACRVQKATGTWRMTTNYYKLIQVVAPNMPAFPDVVCLLGERISTAPGPVCSHSGKHQQG